MSATNKLTSRLSPAAVENVGKLKTHLPDLIEKSGESQLWGVDLNDGNDSRLDIVLNKFLVARDGNVDAAAEQLSKTLAWRKSFNAASTATETFPEDVFGKAGFVAGRAKNGCAIAYTFYGAADPIALFSDEERFIRWRVGLMERAIAQLDFRTSDQILLIGDYGSVSPTAESRAAAKKLATMFTDYYPEMLYRQLFLNIPSWLAWVANIFRPFLPARTFAKFEFIGTSEQSHKTAIQAHVDLDQLPRRYGGTLIDDPLVALDPSKV